MNLQERLVHASADASGSAMFFLQGDRSFAVRLAISTGETANYFVKATLTEFESMATAHQIAGASGASASVLVEAKDIQYYRVLVGWNTLSGGTISIFVNTGNNNP